MTIKPIIYLPDPILRQQSLPVERVDSVFRDEQRSITIRLRIVVREGGAEAADCIPTNWCQPAGFSIDLFVMHTEGLHWHEVTCGLPTEEIARATAAAICTQGARPWIADCQLVQIYDRDGQPQL